VQRALRDLGLTWQAVASMATPAELLGLTVRVAPHALRHPQGYRLVIAEDGISVLAGDAAGAFYGCCTLAQIVEQSSAELPCLTIDDWPDFPARGVMLDVTRDKVPTMATLRGLIDMLAGWKVNQVQLYTEHAFAYRAHPTVWANASPITGEEILELDAFCRERHVELVPNQNSFGHMHRWLRHEQYKPLAESPQGFTTNWGPYPFGLCPLDPGSIELLAGLYDELLPHFSSRMLNVGCDETYDLGKGRSAAECAARGTGRVYLDFLLKIHREVSARGRTMMFWGDIIIKYPELVPALPKDAVALEWGYEATHPFDEHGERFAAAGVPYYVCPGTASWNSLGGRTDNALGNLASAAENGLRHGAIGYLITDWGDNGHWQALPISYLGFAAGAAYSWAFAANRDVPIAPALSRFAFGDPTGEMGQVFFHLGNVYRALGLEPHNSSALFRILLNQLDWLSSRPEITADSLQAGMVAIDAALAPLAGAKLGSPDSAIVARELDNTVRMLRHAGRRGQFALGAEAGEGAKRSLTADLREIIAEYRAIWLLRNRPGGLDDSAARLERRLADYA
jgi:hexosaminidase